MIAKATPRAPRQTYGGGGGMFDAPMVSFQTDFDWSGAPPAWAGEGGYVGGPSGMAGIVEDGIYLMGLGVNYHLTLPVEGDYKVSVQAQLRGMAGSTTQVIGIGRSVDLTVTAPPGTDHSAPFGYDLYDLWAPSEIVLVGQGWYGETVDLNAPAGLAVSLSLSYDYVTMMPNFVAGDEETIVTNADGWGWWHAVPLAELLGGGVQAAGALSAGQVRTGARDSVKMRGGSVKQLEVEAVDHGGGGTT